MEILANSTPDNQQERPLYTNFLIVVYVTKPVYLGVSWSELSPSELVAKLLIGEGGWDIEGTRLYCDGMVARTDCVGDGDEMNDLVRKKAFFLPSTEPNTATEAPW